MIFAPSGAGSGGLSAWVTGTVYTAGEVVYYDRVIYICETSHTAAAKFQTDFAGAKWRPLSEMTVNYLADAQGVQAGKWTAFADAASITPTDGTGGSPTSISVDSTTTTPLRGLNSLLLTKGGSTSAQGEGISYDFTIDKADKGKVLQISFDYFVFSGAATYTDDQLSVWVYDVTTPTMIQCAPYLIKNHSLNSETWFGEFQTSSSSTSYRLLIYCRGTSTTDYQIAFDSMFCGRQAKLYGSPVTDLTDWTPTVTGLGTVTVNRAKWKRVGDEIEAEVRITGGTATGSTVTFTLPAGMAFDYSATQYLGTGATTNTTNPDVQLMWDSSGATNLITVFNTIGGTSGFSALTGTALGNSVVISFKIRGKILGWSSSAVMSSDADTRVVAAQITSSDTPTFATGTPTKATWSSTITDSHGMADLTNDRFNILVPGDYRFSANYFFNSIASTANGSVQMSARVNGTTTYIMGAQGYASGVTQYRGFAGTTLIRNLKAGDYVELVITQDIVATLTALNSLNHFDVERISGPSQIMASETVATRTVRTSSAQSLSTSSATKIQLNSASVDKTGMADTTTNYRITVNSPGLYTIKAGIVFAANATNVRLAMIYKNGVEVARTQSNTNSGSQPAYLRADIDLQLLAGDYIELYGYQDSGGNLNVNNDNNTYLSVIRVGNY